MALQPPANDSFFQPAVFSSSGLPELHEDEFIYISKEASLLTTHPEHKFGTLTLTDRRLIFKAQELTIAGNLSAILSQASPARMFSRSTRIIVTFNPSIVQQSPNEMQIKFQSHNDADEFGELLQTSLDRKSWLSAAKRAANTRAGPRVVGVSGIMKQHEREKRETKSLASDSFKDLEALFSKANSVVQTITKYQAQIDNTSTANGDVNATESASSNEQEVEQMRELLVTIGIRSPVTKSSSGNQFHQNLARELADFLLRGKYLEKSGGMMTLLDVYCLWNRARCLEMISPDDLIEATSLLKPLRLGLSSRKFDSGVTVIQADSHGDEQMCETLERLVITKGSVHSFQVSQHLNIPLALATEHLKIAEAKGCLCRDEHLEQILFYPNLFRKCII